MANDSHLFRRRTVLKTIGGGVVARGVCTEGSAAGEHCDRTVEDGDTVQTAVDNADQGHTVCIEPGTYEENVVVETNDITLTGRGNAVVEGTGVAGGALSIEADGVTVERLRVQHPEGNIGIASRTGVENVTIRDNFVSDIGPFERFGPTGILAEAQTGLTIANNSVFGVTETVVSAQGIFLNDDQGSVIDGRVVGNSVTDLLVEDTGLGGAMGILVQTSGATIRNNAVRNLTGNWAQGVNVHGGNDATVIDNHLDGISGRTYDGESIKIESNGASDIEVTENSLLATVGLKNDSSDELDAACNYWGARNGPDADDTDGDGSKVVGNVDYRPWKLGRGGVSNCRGGE